MCCVLNLNKNPNNASHHVCFVTCGAIIKLFGPVVVASSRHRQHREQFATGNVVDVFDESRMQKLCFLDCLGNFASAIRGLISKL